MPQFNPIVWAKEFFGEIWYNSKLTWFLTWDGRVRLLPKLLPPALLLYGISPIDLSTIIGVFIPVALIPGIAAIDDIYIIKVGLEYFVGVLCPPEVVDEFRDRLEKTEDDDLNGAPDVTNGSARYVD